MLTLTRRYPRGAHCRTLTCANGHTGAGTIARMTDEEIAELVAENQRLRALAEGGTAPEAAPVIIIEAPEPPPVAETVAVIEAETDRTVAIIEAETAQQVAVIEAQAEAEQPKGDSDDGPGGLFMPEADHWYFKRWGKK